MGIRKGHGVDGHESQGGSLGEGGQGWGEARAVKVQSKYSSIYIGKCHNKTPLLCVLTKAKLIRCFKSYLTLLGRRRMIRKIAICLLTLACPLVFP